LTDERFTLINENFRFITILLFLRIEKCGWDFGDWGVSHQFDVERGFFYSI
jgi:hypothetical protein